MAKTPQQYWNERQKQLWANLETSERALQTKLSKYYADEAKSLEKEIGAYFSKYGKDNVIEYRNLLQQLSKADKDLLYRDCERFAKKYPQRADLMPVRTSIYKLDRLQGLEAIIDRVRVRLADETSLKEELLEELTQTAIDRINLKVGDVVFNPLFNSIAVDVVVKMYRRMYFEGIDTEKADTISTKFIENVLAEYGEELASYKKDRLAILNKKVVRFL